MLKKEWNGTILRHNNMVKFAIELKTVKGYRQQSTTGCMREAQLQLVGLNAFNTHSSPPVLLSNLAKTHQEVVYLDKDEEWKYHIAVQDCATFVHWYCSLVRFCPLACFYILLIRTEKRK